jgi:hypothetical protein
LKHKKGEKQMKRICALFCLITAFAATAAAEGVTLYAAHSEGTLNIRETPDGHRVGYLLPGDAVEYGGRQKDGWIYIKIGIEAGGGWVKAEFLTIDPEGAGMYCNTSGGRVRIRKEPGGDSAGWLAADGEIFIKSVLPDEAGELWGCSDKGYIRMQYLEKMVDYAMKGDE